MPTTKKPPTRREGFEADYQRYLATVVKEYDQLPDFQRKAIVRTISGGFATWLELVCASTVDTDAMSCLEFLDKVCMLGLTRISLESKCDRAELAKELTV